MPWLLTFLTLPPPKSAGLRERQTGLLVHWSCHVKSPHPCRQGLAAVVRVKLSRGLQGSAVMTVAAQASGAPLASRFGKPWRRMCVCQLFPQLGKQLVMLALIPPPQKKAAPMAGTISRPRKDMNLLGGMHCIPSPFSSLALSSRLHHSDVILSLPNP